MARILELNRRILWTESQADQPGTVAIYDADGNGLTRSIDDLDHRILSAAALGMDQATLLAQLDLSEDTLLDRIESFHSWSPAVFRWAPPLEEEVKQTKRFLDAAVSMRQQWKASQAAPTTNAEFHATGIQQPTEQFESIETTVAHAFRQPHAGLQGRTYGEAFCDRVIEANMLTPGAAIMEIGCGIGYFALAFLNRLRERRPNLYATIRYSLFDLSPQLQQSQREVCQDHADRIEFLSGNIETAHLDGRHFDLVIANEMIADLSVAAVNPARIHRQSANNEAESVAIRYELDCQPTYHGTAAEVAINLGAIRLLERLPKLLSPGGNAVITEYGYEDTLPKAVPFRDHDEYSIHFGHLVRVARHLELNPQLSNLGSWMGFDYETKILTTAAQDTLTRVLLRAIGGPELPTLAYDYQQLQAALGPLLTRIHHLEFVPLSSDATLGPQQFFALHCTRR